MPDNASSRSNPIIYGPENLRAKQPVDEFMMPMAFHQLNKFEQLNQVRVKVFRHTNKKLIPFGIWSNQNIGFNLHLR